MRNSTVCLLIVSVTCLVASTAAIDCYHCTTADAACVDQFVPKGVGNKIVKNQAYCMKTKSMTSNGIQRVTRSGSPKGSASFGCNVQKVKGVETTYCLCNGNLCNGAGRVGHLPLVTLFACVVFAAWFTN